MIDYVIIAVIIIIALAIAFIVKKVITGYKENEDAQLYSDAVYEYLKEHPLQEEENRIVGYPENPVVSCLPSPELHTTLYYIVKGNKTFDSIGNYYD